MSWQVVACSLYTPTGYRFQGFFIMDHSACSHASHPAEAIATDPVCGMKVDPAKSSHRHTRAGQDYFFCSAGCRGKFAADPEKYLNRAASPPPAQPKGTIYTCPMHPQIRQVGPGHCPICGMALEPETASAEATENAELTDMRRRFWIGLALTVPVLALEMGGDLFDLRKIVA